MQSFSHEMVGRVGMSIVTHLDHETTSIQKKKKETMCSICLAGFDFWLLGLD